MITIDDIDEEAAKKIMNFLFKQAGYELFEIINIRHDDGYFQFIPRNSLFLARLKWLNIAEEEHFKRSMASMPVMIDPCSPTGEKAMEDYDYSSMPHIENTAYKEALELMFSMLSISDGLVISVGYLSPVTLLSRKDSICSLLMKIDLQDDDS